ncbi:hypothetical protein F511_26999 [Dorcoceras hygrometricum]|uniref:Uncharacterized protein n=1 Tax=Dorcoceras hygrometricum TaxID=472368 RepID=A0A2Z7CI42_9LAMI|nr:hypothetical protein F511_26999 [Dorcoceras hygrometricum]
MAGRGRGRRGTTEGDSESEGTNPVLASMSQLLERLVDQTNQGNGKSSGRMISREDPQERFRRQRPQEFAGSLDPLIAESWIKSMEVIFEYLHLTDLERPREHCDVLSMQMDSDLVIYQTILVRAFQVSTGCVLGKWVYLVTLAMSLFDLQDVCVAIGSLATLDLPMVVDLIGIYVLKGPYCTLTTTKWFLQALSVIPRGSWGDVARRFTMIRWASPKL